MEAGNRSPSMRSQYSLRLIERQAGDVQLRVRSRTDAEFGAATLTGADPAARPIARIGRVVGVAALATDDDIEDPVEVAHDQPGESLRTIGFEVAARGKFSRQSLPRSPAISHPGGGASEA